MGCAPLSKGGLTVLSFLREADKSDGSPGPLSARRIAAFILILEVMPLFYLALKFSANGWFVFLPGGMCLVAAILLFFFTTWADVKEIISAAAGLKRGMPDNQSPGVEQGMVYK
jgi:hypothetical protein